MTKDTDTKTVTQRSWELRVLPRGDTRGPASWKWQVSSET